LSMVFRWCAAPGGSSQTQLQPYTMAGKDHWVTG
jgi:hypothetical protein